MFLPQNQALYHRKMWKLYIEAGKTAYQIKSETLLSNSVYDQGSNWNRVV